MSLRFKLKYLLYFFLVLYIVFLAVSIVQIDGLMNYARENIFFVKDKTRDIRSRINEQPNIVPGLLSNPGLLYDGLAAEFTRQENIRQPVLLDIKKYYPGNARAVDSLLEAFREYRAELRKLAAQMEFNDDFDLAVHNYQQELMPYVRQILSILNEMDVNMDLLAKEVDDRIKFRMNLLIGLSVGFGILLLLFFIMADRREAAKNHEIEYREKLFNQLSQNVEEVFIVASGSDDFAYVSPNIKALMGLDAEKTLENPSLLYASLPDADIADSLRSALDSPEISFPETTVIRADLNKSFLLRLYSIGNVSGKKERYIISFSDQTQSIQHQEALALALRNAHAASEAKSGFLSHMSHEIRTPMNAIIGMTTIALSRINELPRVKDCLEKISDSSRHLLGLINDVLDMSKIESGKFTINREPFNLLHNLNHIRNVGQVQAQAKNLDFEVIIENVKDDVLIGDSLRLNQVLLNLLSNAWKFTPAGGKTSLTVRQTETRDDIASFFFIVEDNGIGMSQEFLQRIYEPFEQASASVATKYGGTGLGMPITFNIVTLMGGTITVESKEGKGTKFTVALTFPLDEAGSSLNSSLRGLTALIVDDDPGSREHLALLLAKMGIESAAAQDGEAALEMARKAVERSQSYDIVIIDWKMPGMDGLETARRIREIVGEDASIIIASAYDLSVIKADANGSGVNEFVAKPLFSSTLHDALVAARHRREQGGQQREPEKKAYNFSGKRVLLVEDNEFNSEIAQEFLEMAKVEVELAENGAIAVEKMKKSPPGYYDLILMDVQMPVMDGYEATRQIRASCHPRAKDIPILAMTADAFTEDVAKALASGMNSHLAKPIDIDNLYENLAQYLNGGD